MTPEDTLMAQASALLDNLNRQHARMGSLAAPGADGNSKANNLILGQLRKRLAEQVDKLEDLIDSDLRGADLSKARPDFRKIDSDCRSLFGECLAVSIAPAIRSLSLDDGACSIIERLLRGLGDSVGVPWPHVTTLADSEFFGTASQVIRVRYPAPAIWDYSIAAHEFGHFIGPRWPSSNGDRTGYQSFLDVKDLGCKAHLEEYFADLFATFALGPAYVCTCLLHRFDPTNDGDDYHPSDRHRAVWMLNGLELLAEQGYGQGAQILRTIVASRAREWNQTVDANGGTPIDQNTVITLRIRARRLWKDLMGFSGDAAFTDLTPAMNLRADFSGGRQTTARSSVGDVLNAAWLIRLENRIDLRDPQSRVTHGQKLDAIDKWAKTLCLGSEQ